MRNESRGAVKGGTSAGLVLSLLLAANLINFVDRHLLAGFANDIVADLHLSATEFGLLTGLGFTLFYALASLVMGALADLANRTRLMSVAVGSWSVLTAASGLATSFLGLAIPRLLIGVGEAALTPAAVSLLGERITPERRGFAVGVYYAGVPLGVGASLIIAGLAGPRLGWRACFAALGVIGVVCSLLLLFVRDRRASHRGALGSIPALATQFGQALSALRQLRALRLVVLGGLFINAGLAAGNFDQLWLVRERHFDKATIAVLTGLAACAGGLVGNLVGGWGGDAWHRRTGKSRVTFLAWLLIAFAPLILVYRLVSPESPLFWAGLLAGYVQLGAFYGPTFASIQQLCSPGQRATATGVTLFAHNVIGFGLATSVAGWAVDRLKAAAVPHAYSDVLFAISCLPLLGVPFLLAVDRATTQDSGLAARAMQGRPWPS